MKRSDFIASAGIISLGLPLVQASSIKKDNNPVLRIAHITDTHIEPDGPSAKGVTAAFQKVQSLKNKPDFIFVGGDCIFDANKREKEKVKQQWALWNAVLKQENSLPFKACIGNHDVYGWGMKDNALVTKDSRYGKQWAAEELKMPNCYYSFDKAGWRFIVLDSTHFSEEHDYLSKLDDEQFEWLVSQLKNTSINTPICILSHMPIVSFASCIFDNNYLGNSIGEVYKWGLIHTDVIKIKNLFYQYPNVKLCLAGHLHMQEIVEYLGVKYVCSGAVSGNWWKGNRFEFTPSFSIIELFADGSSAVQFTPY